LAQVTNGNKWRIRAHQFASLSFSESILKKVKEAPDTQRKVKGVPDKPYSLLEGIAGDVISYSDVIAGKGKFPGYEL